MLKEDLRQDVEARVAFLKKALAQAGAKGFVYGNSGGKDCTLVGILCKLACENTFGVCMPCSSSQNYGRDLRDGMLVAKAFGIETVTVDLSQTKDALMAAVTAAHPVAENAAVNVAPRLRMATLYAVAQTRGALVAGTGNRSERYLGYFTKWGDGACDVNPIADLTVREVYKLLRYLRAPEPIINKQPSAGLFEGQTDEAEMGLSYADIDAVVLGRAVDEAARAKIERMHRVTEHKRRMPSRYGEGQSV